MEIGAWLVCAGLFAFGMAYDFTIGYLEAKGHAEGYTAFFVVFGVAVTLGGIAYLDTALDWNAGLIGLMAFAFSGFPMTLGAMWRYAKAREKAREASNDDKA